MGILLCVTLVPFDSHSYEQAHHRFKMAWYALVGQYYHQESHKAQITTVLVLFHYSLGPLKLLMLGKLSYLL